MQHPRVKLDDAAQRRALRVISSGGTVTDAARAAGCSPRTIRWRRQHDPAFARAFAEAKEQLLDELEREAIRRATEGHWEVVVHPDGSQTRKLKVSDQLLLALLRKHDPSGYGTDRLAVDATTTTRIEQAAIQHRLGRMPVNDKREMLRLLDAATGPDGTFDVDRLGHADRARFDELATALGFHEPTLELGE
jgi:hypothetical protein